ncbi:MAG TPA: hypothetical protein VMO00_21020 [Methylomirabilota bacterium]|nr:hypothetical protein [Methylomirabilota bacterium]
MRGFSSSFLIFFYQIALGGLFALSVTPFQELERGFYKSTGGVLLVIALLGLWGKTSLYWETLSNHFSPLTAAEILFHVAFAISLTCYMISLWGERQRFRARSFASSILSGLGGLILSAHSFYVAPAFSLETFIYPASFFLSALLLGSVTVGMLIGHWYLIDTGQSLEPFIRVYKFFVITLIVQALFLSLSSTGLYFFGSFHSIAEIERLWLTHSTLLVTRVLVGQIAPLILSWMIWRTLLIPHTMAATGLFYIALLGVFVGEILGRQILALTSLPF